MLRDRIEKWAAVSRDYQKQCAAEKGPHAPAKSEFHRGAAEAFERVLDELRTPDDPCKRESCGHTRKHHRANGCMGWSGHVCACTKFLEKTPPKKAPKKCPECHEPVREDGYCSEHCKRGREASAILRAAPAGESAAPPSPKASV